MEGNLVFKFMGSFRPLYDGEVEMIVACQSPEVEVMPQRNQCSAINPIGTTFQQTQNHTLSMILTV